MNYEKALKVLDTIPYTTLIEEQINAIEKAKEALEHCLSIGLDGEGD